jgi:hypothetical protein
LQKAILYILSQGEDIYGNLIADYEHNKIIDLLIARKIGFNVPVSLLLDSSSLNTLDQKKYISKSIHNKLNTQFGAN